MLSYQLKVHPNALDVMKYMYICMYLKLYWRQPVEQLIRRGPLIWNSFRDVDQNDWKSRASWTRSSDLLFCVSGERKVFRLIGW